ncbi:MAG: nitronate monooxygenase [Ramlibacter sp.]|nr:nitronate monooxygenase [Ramlibacter sp.]
MTLPILQAPIGSMASPELAAAVCEAGGLGQLSFTWKNAGQQESDMEKMRLLTKRNWGANFVLDFPVEEQLARALDRGVGLVSFFWGDGSEHLPSITLAGAVSAQVVGTVDEARRAADAGFDIVVAQGAEAGGHVRGTMGTLALVPQVVDAVSPLPVVAAGGIADRRGVAAAFALGAAGVWVGTRFLAAREADVHPVYRDEVLRATGDRAIRCEAFDIGWPAAPHRVLVNSTVRAWTNAGRPRAPHRPGEAQQVALRPDGSGISRYHFAAPHSGMSGDVEAMALYAGEGVGLVREVEPAATIVADLARGIPELAG